MRANEGSRKSTVYSHVAVSSLIGLFEATRPFSGAFIHIIYDWLHIYIYIYLRRGGTKASLQTNGGSIIETGHSANRSLKDHQL